MWICKNIFMKNLFVTLQQSFSRYPCVFKVGHAHSGVGKVRVENAASFQVITFQSLKLAKNLTLNLYKKNVSFLKLSSRNLTKMKKPPKKYSKMPNSGGPKSGKRWNMDRDESSFQTKIIVRNLDARSGWASLEHFICKLVSLYWKWSRPLKEKL